MSNRRVAARAAAISAGVVVVGAMGAGPALAGSGPLGGGGPLGGSGGTSGSGTLGGVVSSGGKAVHKATHKLDQSKKHHKKNKGTSGGPGSLTGTVDKTVKAVTKTADKAASTASATVKHTAKQLTGGSKPPSGAPLPGGSGTPKVPGNGSGSHAHGAAGSRHASTSTILPGATQARSGRSYAGAGSAPLVSAGYPASAFAPGTMGRTDFGGYATPATAPRVAAAPALRPQVAAPAHQQSGAVFDLAHPAAMLPRVVHDRTLQLELLIVAGVLAGGVAAGHVFARRRVTTRPVAVRSSQPVATGPLTQRPAG
jgi:hypothetical protein